MPRATSCPHRAVQLPSDPEDATGAGGGMFATTVAVSGASALLAASAVEAAGAMARGVADGGGADSGVADGGGADAGRLSAGSISARQASRLAWSKAISLTDWRQSCAA